MMEKIWNLNWNSKFSFKFPLKKTAFFELFYDERQSKTYYGGL